MSQYSIILAIDTATGPASVAVWKDGKISAYLESEGQRMQSAQLLPMIERVLKQTRIGYDALTGVACTTGPGSFTGIRVGLSAARTVMFATEIKGFGFTTLEVLAFTAIPHAGGKPILAALNAGKGEYYFQAFQSSPWQALSEPGVGSPEDAAAAVSGAVLAGNVDLPGLEKAPIHFPRADALAELAAVHGSWAQDLKPFYIRAPDALLPKTFA